jgi:hypothetical protein
VVVIRTPEEVVIAADSASTIRSAHSAPRTKSVCKIFEISPTLFFAVSGLVGDSFSGFRVPELVAVAAAGNAGGMRTKLALAESAVEKALLDELPRLRVRDPAG